MSIEKCADAVFESVRTYLEKRLQELPAPRDGKDGADGAQGKAGENGKDADPAETAELITRQVRMAVEALPAPQPGKNGVDGAPGEKGLDGAPGRDGIDGADGPAGPEGPPGKEGTPGSDGADGAKGLDGAQGSIGPAGDPGQAGERGKDGSPGERGEPGVAGHDGADGATGLAGTKGLDGEPGRDGRDGPPGRDAAQIDILPAINEERSYARGTWASHKGGIWRAMRATEGLDGWECLHVGLADIQIEVSEDGRTITEKHIMSDGRVIAHARKTVEMIYRGIFKDGDDYEHGDTVTWGGSLWHCNESTKDKPLDGSKSWVLCAKKGRDGKDGPPGTKGDKGLDGRAGRDLTQMLADGRKF